MPHHHHHNDRTFRAEDAHKLENPERTTWLPPQEVLERAGVVAGMRVADVGAGTGYFALPLARRVGDSGRVYAIDLQPEMLALLHKKLEGASLPIETMQGTAEATGLPDASVDMVLLANVWHEVEDTEAASREARRVLRKDGRIVIVDWRDDVSPPPGPPSEHRIAASAVAAALGEAGWSLASSDPVGPFSYVVVATRT